MKIADLLRRDQGGSASIREAIREAEEAGKAATARLESLTRERATALLADDERGLDRIERALTQAQRDVDRADLACVELGRRLEAAQAAERQAALDAAHARGKAAQARAVGLIRKDYPKLAEKLGEILEELRRLDGEVADANRTLAEGGDPRRLAEPDRLARPQPNPGFQLPPATL